MRRIVMVGFPGAQVLDLLGPAEFFASAHRLEGADYEVVLASVRGGPMVTSAATLETHPLRRLKPGPRDTVLVAGGSTWGVSQAVKSKALGQWLLRASTRVERLGSVCSGAFVLAALGLLDGKRAATHWSAVEQLRTFRPAVKVDPDAIYVHDGLWTSAGVTTGIDLALALLEADHGASVASSIAANLVLYARRPGFQSQFSEVLVAQREKTDPLGTVIAQARAHVKTATVSELARWGAMSERTFHRRCQAALHLSPARLLQRLRVEAARVLVCTTEQPLKRIAVETGFGSDDALVAGFQRELGLTPSQVRLLHRNKASVAQNASNKASNKAMSRQTLGVGPRAP
jgi:transcriptional regulator GlxA family with amidase domain